MKGISKLMRIFWTPVFLILLSLSQRSAFEYETKTFTVPLDHFTFTSNATFEIRYLINNSYVKDSKSPILFYTGNEGDIELFANNTGLMWEIAPQINAMIVFAEHRYYGKSLPFGDKSYDSPKHLGFLTSEQALADFSLLLNDLNPSTSVLMKKNRPVIAFGGSYGGMLSAWFRMKYPHIVHGSIASSAPILQFTNLTPCNAFNRILTSVFATAFPGNNNCSRNIKKSFDVMRTLIGTPDGKATLNKIFKFCNSLNGTDDLYTFEEYLEDVYGNIAMMNYPYSTNFIAKLPAFPVREFCNLLQNELNDTQLIESLKSSLSMYTNSTGDLKCLDISVTTNPTLGDLGWDFQACTEMVMPMCSTGKSDMFPKKEWNFGKYSDDCFKKFGIRPKENFAVTNYGGVNLEGASNIIFSNGLLDPWSGGGVLRSVNDKVKIIIIPEGAHHIDLRSSNVNDPDSVIEARNFELNTIKSWIDSYWS